MSGRTFRTYERFGYLISRTAGADAPWRGWREDGATFRADTLKGALAMASRQVVNRDGETARINLASAGRYAVLIGGRIVEESTVRRLRAKIAPLGWN